MCWLKQSVQNATGFIPPGNTVRKSGTGLLEGKQKECPSERIRWMPLICISILKAVHHDELISNVFCEAGDPQTR